MHQLRPYQIDGDMKIRQAFMQGAKSVCYCLPTGGGKTVVFSNIVSGVVKKQKTAFILTHRDKLLRQAHDHLTELGIPHGLIKAGYTASPFEAIQVASKDTLVKRLHLITKSPDLIITDEAHHSCAKSYLEIYKAFPNALHLGVTATPIRLDGKGLDSVFDTLVLGPTTKELIDMGYLSKYVLYGSPDNIDFSAVKSTAGDFNIHQIDELMDKPKIIGNAVKHYQKLCFGKKTVAFCCTVRHAEDVAYEFNTHGIPAISIDGKLSSDEIAKRLFDFQMGKYWVLTSCDLISEGMDLPAIECVIMLRPTMSLSLYLQMIGRGLRIFAGKVMTIILDHVNNFTRHGLPDDDRVWSLDGVKAKTKDEVIEDADKHRECPECYLYHVVPPDDHCPGCGYVYTAKERKKLKEIEGELIAINEEKLIREREEKRIKQLRIWGCKTYSDFLTLEKEFGYKSGWAYFKWKDYDSKHKKKAS